MKNVETMTTQTAPHTRMTRAGVRRRQQMIFALQILFAVVAAATLALLAPVDWQQYFQSGSDAWRAKR